jgi:hypothetical protein
MTKEKFTVDGSQLVEKVKELIREGNIRRIRLLHKGHPLIDIPLSVGVPVAAAMVVAAPVLAGLGAIAALVTECTVEVERVDDTSEKKNIVPKNTKGNKKKNEKTGRFHWLVSSGDFLPRLKSWASNDSSKLRRIACSSCFNDPTCNQP